MQRREVEGKREKKGEERVNGRISAGYSSVENSP